MVRVGKYIGAVESQDPLKKTLGRLFYVDLHADQWDNGSFEVPDIEPDYYRIHLDFMNEATDHVRHLFQEERQANLQRSSGEDAEGGP